MRTEMENLRAKLDALRTVAEEKKKEGQFIYIGYEAVKTQGKFILDVYVNLCPHPGTRKEGWLHPPFGFLHIWLDFYLLMISFLVTIATNFDLRYLGKNVHQA